MGAVVTSVVVVVVVVVGCISAVVRVSSSPAGQVVAAAGVLGSGFAEVVDLPLERRLLGSGVGFTCCFVTAAGSSVAGAGGSVSPSPVVSGPGGASVVGVSVLQKINVKETCDGG